MGEEEDWKFYKSMKMMVVMWFYGFVVMFFFFLGWGLFLFEFGGIICILNWWDNILVGYVYLIIFVILVFVVFLYVFLVCFVRIYWKLRKFFDENLRMIKEKILIRKVVRMVVFGIVSFFISWIFYCVFVMILVIGGLEIFDRD